MIFPIVLWGYPHLCPETAGEAFVGVVAVFQGNGENAFVGFCQICGGKSDPASAHIAHDTVPHNFPKHALIVVFGQVDAFREAFHGQLPLNVFLDYREGTKYRVFVVPVLLHLNPP